MNLDEIRVTYSGLISFLGGIISIVTGITATLIITRTLTPEEYGTWGLIITLIVYVSMINPIISYWSTRDTARNIESGKSAVLSTMLLSVGGASLYILISYFMGYYTDVNQSILLIGVILIPVIFLNGIFTAINLGWKPHAISYGTLAYGISSIPLLLIFLYYPQLLTSYIPEIPIISPNSSVILGIFFANIISIIVLFYFARKKITGQFNKNTLKKWLKLSWLPLYPGVYVIVGYVDISIFTIITGSVIGLGFWTAAMVLPGIISHSALISRAVYPKLLAEKTREFISDNLTHLFYFGVLLTAIAITFARPGLYALNPVYEIAVPVVIIMAFEGFLVVLTNVFLFSLAGIENVDKYEKSTFRDYIKSKLFFPQTLRLIQATIYIGIFTVGLIILVDLENSNQELLIYWASVALITQAPLTVLLYYLLQKNISIKFDVYRILKYLFISIGSFSITYLLMDQFLIYSENLPYFILNVLMFLAFGVSLYIMTTYLIDNKIRDLFNAVIHEIKPKKS